MRILVIGSGAREHAIVTALEKDPEVSQLHVSPGNAGMGGVATIHPDADPEQLAVDLGVDVVVIGPEAPLVAGLGDALRARGIPVFGPSAAAAQLEGSKLFAKDVMQAAGVRTADARRVETAEQIEAALRDFGPHYVVKDDGLAGGKGVVVTDDPEVARNHATEVLGAGNPVLFESFLDGPEVSLFCLVDGETVVPLLPAQDHKRAYDNNEGPNTGGMGAYAPVPWLPEDGVDRIVREVCEPVAAEMVKRGTPYSGLLYAGLAWGKEGPAVVEFNCRFGDPETQAVLALLDTPLGGLLSAVAQGTLAEQPPLKWAHGSAVTVVLAAEGYPASPVKGDVIEGVDNYPAEQILHAGTAWDSEGNLVSAGGRVLSVVGTGTTLEQAREQAYQVIDGVRMRGSFYRRDIALPAVNGEISI